MTFSKEIEIVHISGVQKVKQRRCPSEFNGYYKKVHSRYEHVENSDVRLTWSRNVHTPGGLVEWHLRGVIGWEITNQLTNIVCFCPTQVELWVPYAKAFHRAPSHCSDMKVEKIKLEKIYVILRQPFEGRIPLVILSYWIDQKVVSLLLNTQQKHEL